MSEDVRMMQLLVNGGDDLSIVYDPTRHHGEHVCQVILTNLHAPRIYAPDTGFQLTP